MAAGTGLPPQLLKFWTVGEGGAKIRWGESGDYDRCIRLVQEAVVKDGKPPLGDQVIHGMCATLHKVATGARPGHAAGEHG